MKYLFPVGLYDETFNSYLPFTFSPNMIYQSSGLQKHIQKRHPECLCYLPMLPDIISSPDYIGINPNEKEPSFELVKRFDKNIQIGIKFDCKNKYLYVATLHTITTGKINHGIDNGRLKKIDKQKNHHYNCNK